MSKRATINLSSNIKTRYCELFLGMLRSVVSIFLISQELRLFGLPFFLKFGFSRASSSFLFLRLRCCCLQSQSQSLGRSALAAVFLFPSACCVLREWSARVESKLLLASRSTLLREAAIHRCCCRPCAAELIARRPH